MAINKENYPEYFLDFFEGRLSEADKADLFVFLDDHPELKEEFEAFDMVGLEPDTVIFPDRESLKRGMITPANYEWYFAAYVEGDLSDDERAAVTYFASGSAEMERELRMMQLAVLDTDHAVAFPGKASLKHASESSSGSSAPGGRRIYLARPWYYIAAAAVVLWLAGLFFLRTPDPAINNLFSDLPAVEEADEPRAVAEIPSSTRGPEEAVARPEEAVTRTKVAVTSPDQSPVALTETRNMSEPSNPIPQQSYLIAGAMASLQPVNTRQAVSRSEPVSLYASYEAIAYKTEFAYWSQDLLPTTYYTEEEYGLITQQSPGEAGLTQLALNGLQQALPVDFSKVDDHLSQGRIPLKELAGRGLAELGIIATNALGIERETDDQGRTLAIRAGDIFEARRSNR